MASEELNRNYVLYQHFIVNQINLDIAFEKYSQIRHYHGNDTASKMYSIMILLGNAVARSVNATLIGKGHPYYRPGNFPIFVPFLSQFSSVGQSVENYWNHYQNVLNRKVGMPLTFRHGHSDFNFVYCSDLKMRQELLWDFSMFTKSLDRCTWLALSASILFVSLLTRTSGFTEALFITLEALITPSASGNIRQRWSVFTLWMLVSLVLVTFYSGNMTSHVISPSKEDTISDIVELEHQNYQLYMGDSTSIFIVNSSTQALFNKSYVTDDMKCLARLIDKAVIDPLPVGFLEVAPEILATSGDKKLAFLYIWQFTYIAASLANDRIAEMSKKSGTTKTKKCYVGKRLIPTAESYSGILPPGNVQLGKIFERFNDAGIPGRFFQEFLETCLSQRVQNRVKFRGLSSKMVEIDENEIVALSMQDKMGRIFVLWGTCLLAGVICFVIEMSVQKLN